MNIYKLPIYNGIVSNLLEALNPEPFSEAGQNLAKLCLATKQKFSALKREKRFLMLFEKATETFFLLKNSKNLQSAQLRSHLLQSHWLQLY